MFSFNVIVVIFCIYTILLAIFSFILVSLLATSPILLILGAIPNGFLDSIFTLIKIATPLILFEWFAVNIWKKVYKSLKISKSDDLDNQKNIIWMIILSVILSILLAFVGKDISESQMDRKRYEAETQQRAIEREQERIEDNKIAAQNCIKVKGLCVTSDRISYDRGDTFNESLNNAKKVCSDLGMRLPTKKEYDLILTPLTSFKQVLERNPSDEEFVAMQKYYDNNLKKYHLLFWHDNFLTSSTVGSKAVTYKVDNERQNNGGCRNVRTKKVYGQVCISATISTPTVEYHEFDEPIDKTIYFDYSLHCVK